MRPSWDEVCLEVADVVSQRSLCSRARVGAVVCTAEGRIHSTGYNNPARGFDHENKTCTEWCPRSSSDLQRGKDYSNCISIHAEMNALLRADYTKIEGGTIYVTRSCCVDCAKTVANSGVARVVCRDVGFDIDPQREYVEEYLTNLGIKVEFYG